MKEPRRPGVVPGRRPFIAMRKPAFHAIPTPAGLALVGIDNEGRARGPWTVDAFASADRVALLLSAFPELVAELLTGSPELHVQIQANDLSVIRPVL